MLYKGSTVEGGMCVKCQGTGKASKGGVEYNPSTAWLDARGLTWRAKLAYISRT